MKVSVGGRCCNPRDLLRPSFPARGAGCKAVVGANPVGLWVLLLPDPGTLLVSALLPAPSPTSLGHPGSLVTLGETKLPPQPTSTAHTRVLLLVTVSLRGPPVVFTWVRTGETGVEEEAGRGIRVSRFVPSTILQRWRRERPEPAGEAGRPGGPGPPERQGRGPCV